MEGTRRRVRYADVMSTVAVFLALCGGAWAVQSQSAATRTIRACVSKRSGSLRVLAAGRRCARTERTLAWNQRGPAGVRGLAGAQGQAGAPGAQGPAGSDAQFTGAAAGGALSGTYPNPALAANAVGTSALAAGAVTGAKIANATIANANIAPLTITGGSLANATVTGAKVASNTLTGAQIDESTLSGLVPGSGSSNATQLAGGAGSTTILTTNGATARVSCTQPVAGSLGSSLDYRNDSGASQLVIAQSQVAAGTATMTSNEVASGGSLTSSVVATSAANRGARTTFTISSDNGDVTTLVVEVITSYFSGGTCLARATGYTLA